MSLARRRFPDTITRRRPSGERDENGEWVEGAVAERQFPASVQPIEVERSVEASGVRLDETRRVFVPVPVALRAADEVTAGDRVVLADGGEFTVAESRSWARSHTRATLVRIVVP